MYKILPQLLLNFCSYNRKSKIKNQKRAGLSAIACVFVVAGAVAQAQQPEKIPRIGYLAPLSPASESARTGAFNQGLRDLGYIEGKNILVEYRYAEGNIDRLSGFVAELVQLKIDVLVAEGLSAARAAKKLTKMVPIITVTSGDPVAAGIVDSLARPGGNITGLTRLTRDLSGKRLELLKETVPRMSRVGILLATGTGSETAAMGFKEYEVAARALKIQLQPQEVRGSKPDLDGAFEAAAKGRVQAMIVSTSPLIRSHTKAIADLAIKNRLPSMYEASDFVEAGGLVSYSTNDAEVFRRAATYIDKILKGTMPADLPVEQPTKFEFVINLKTAKQIGLTIPPNVLARADKVIK
jgi:putative ABC transport system substrate-binding protein